VLKQWYNDIVKPNITEESLLLLDSIGGFNKATDNDGEEDSNADPSNAGWYTL